MRITSKRRMASTTIGIIIAIAIVFSVFTLGNNVVKAQLYDALTKENYQITFSADLAAKNYEQVVKKLQNIPHVDAVDAMMGSYPFCKEKNLTLGLFYFENWEKYTKLVVGKFPSKAGDIDLSINTAKEYNITLGETLNVSYQDGNRIKTVTFHVTGFYSKVEHISWQMMDALTTIKTMEIINDTNLYGGVKVNINYLLSSGDINEVDKKLAIVQMEVRLALAQYSNGFSVNYQLSYTPNLLTSITYLIFSLPLIVMGAYLSKVGIEIELNERRREFGILRIRGASNTYRFKFLIYEAIIYSLIGGITGYILGEFLAYAGNEMMFHLPFFTPDWNVWYGIGAVITAMFLFFIALYKPWKKMKNVPMLELISHYNQSFKKVDYSPMKDIIKSAVMWAYIITGIVLTQNVSLSNGLNMITLIAVIIISTLMFLFPVILILLPLYMARLLTLGTQRLYEYFAMMFSKISGVAGELVKTGVRRNPKNMAYIAFILAFILTFSTFISSTYDNEQAMQEIKRIQEVGGDFKTTDGNVINWNITASKNVSKYAWINVNGERFGYSGNEHTWMVFGESVQIAMVDFSNYKNAVYHLNVFIKSGSFEKGKVVINSRLAKSCNIHVGDIIQIYSDTSYNGKKYVVSGIVYSFPGLPESTDIGYVMIDKKVEPQNASALILKASNYDALKKELENYGLQFEERKGNADKYTISFLKTLDMFMLLLGGATIFIIQYSLYFNRRGELSLYKVRGATKRQVTNVLMVEGSTIIVLATIIGVSIGLALTYTLVNFMYVSSSLPVYFVIGQNFGAVTGIMLLVFFLAQYIISTIFARVKITNVIRALGGEM